MQFKQTQRKTKKTTFADDDEPSIKKPKKDVSVQGMKKTDDRNVF